MQIKISKKAVVETNSRMLILNNHSMIWFKYIANQTDHDLFVIMT